MIGRTLSHYAVVAKLGSGGMGEVFVAEDQKLGRKVALKVLPTELADDTNRRQRFEREARAVAALSHPNVLAIHDFGEHEGISFAVMELLDGETLRERIELGSLPPSKVVDYARQMAEGLAAAHEKGVVHRDLKPENIFVTGDGRVKILDFGLAQLGHTRETTDESQQTATRATEPGAIMGTVGYMSPEQVRGRSVDPRSDIFSLGVMLYEMLSGHRPFHGESSADTMSAILKEDPAPLSRRLEKISAHLERIVTRCLREKPR